MSELTADKGSFERLLRPLRRGLNADFAAALLRMRADDELERRYEDLAGRHTEGLLSADEKGELDLIVRANLMLSVLKAEAGVFLQRSNVD